MAPEFLKDRVDATPTKGLSELIAFRLVRPSLDVNFNQGSDARIGAREGCGGKPLDRRGGLRRER